MEHIGETIKRLPPRTSDPASAEPSIEVCPICHGNGFVHPMEGGRVQYDRVVPCKCIADTLEKEKRNRYLKYCDLPRGTEHMTFATFKTGGNASLIEALNCAKVLAEGSEDIRWLTLIGKVDRGKTHLAVAICRHRIEQGRSAKYTFIPLLLKQLKDGFELEGEESYRRKMNAICETELLVMDDLGTERASPWAQEQIQMIVHYRGINGLPLVVTSNRRLDDLPIDPEFRIASRLQREEWCRVVVLDVGEHRLGGNQ